MPIPSRMADVAKLAGVSTMTVSRALNNHHNVSGETRQKVLAAATQLHYQPNEMARLLRDGRSRQIGVIVPYLFDPFFAMCSHIISTIAKQHAYAVVLSTSSDDPQCEFDEATRMLRRNVEGLIVVPARSRDSGSPLLDQAFKRLPIVSIDRPIEGSSFPSATVENERGAQLGAGHLIRLGQKRIAYIGLSDELYTMRMRRQGYHKAMTDAGLESEVIQISAAPGDALDAVRRLLTRHQPPTALLCANNLVTRHVLHGMQGMGLYPPHPVALVGFDDFDTADLLRPGITVVRQPAEQLARRAAEMLFHQLADGKRPRSARSVSLPVELIIRGSCGAIV